MPNLIFLACPSLQVLSQLKRGTPDFRISGQSLIYRNCHNSRTSGDTDIKLGPVTKLDKNCQKTKKIDDDVISKNYDVIPIFQIYGQFGAIWKLDSRCIVCKTHISLTVTSNPTKTEKRTKKFLA